jgi:hypothetical protein
VDGARTRREQPDPARAITTPPGDRSPRTRCGSRSTLRIAKKSPAKKAAAKVPAKKTLGGKPAATKVPVKKALAKQAPARKEPAEKAPVKQPPAAQAVASTAASPYAPFTIHNARDTQWKDVRLSFYDWAWLENTHGSITIDGYYMNGYGVEGLVRAVMFANEIDPDGNGIEGNSEGDTCLLHFTSLELATKVAHLAAAMIKDPTRLAEMIQIARDQGFED